MKLHTERNDVERFNVNTESAFRIKTTAKAFDILSSGLYTDRVLAVVRELSCNAYDAHTAANNADPFEIHLPNALEPWFSVKDYGTGLSDNDVMNLYSTYFDSTKTTSNDYIGALGLGSKSPFSYTKAFEVISRHDHVRRLYSVFINEDGVPTIAKLGEFVTDEHNGLEVKVTAKREDFTTFHDKVRHALRWFPIKPKIVGTVSFTWPEIPKENLSGKGWAMFDTNFTNDYSRMTAVQGNVAYKVDISKLNLSGTDNTLLQNGHVVGFFDIGELEVAASREEIRYDDRSVAALLDRIKTVRAGILASIEAKVEGMIAAGDTSWTIMIKLDSLAEEMFHSRRTFYTFINTSKNPTLQWYVAADGSLKLPIIKGHSILAYNLAGDTVKRMNCGTGISPQDNMVVFLNDMKIGGVSKIHHYLRTNANTPRHRYAVVIRRLEEPNEFLKPTPEEVKAGKLTGAPIPWADDKYEDEFEQIVAALGNVEVKLASTDAPVVPRRESEYKSVPVFQFSRVVSHRNRPAVIEWDRVEGIDFNTGGLYVLIRNGSKIVVADDKGNETDVSWETSRTKEHLEGALVLINKAQGTKYEMKDIFAMGAQAAKKVKKLPNWFNVFDILKSQMAQYKPSAEHVARVDNTSDLHGIRKMIVSNGAGSTSRKRFKEHLNKLSNKSVFKQTMTHFIEEVEKHEKLQGIAQFMRDLDVDLGTKIFDNLNDKPYYDHYAFKDYPMLTFIQQYSYLDTKQIELFFDYIDTIDRS